MSHLSILKTRLSNERARLSNATCPGEIKMRTVWVQQMEKEVSGEEDFLIKNDMSDAATATSGNLLVSWAACDKDAELLRELEK